MGCLNMHDKHLKVNKSGGSSISPIPISSSISTFPALSKMEGNGGGVTSKQIKKIISMAHETMTEETTATKAANKKQITALSMQLNGTLGKQCCQPGCRKNKKCVHT